MTEQKQYTLEELKELLNDKQKVFCHNYIIEWNGSKSYKEAYPNVTDETARVNASKLLTNTNITQYIEYIKNDYEKEAGITKLSQIKGFQDIIDDKDASFRDKISARVELNKMLGYNEAEKHDHNVSTNVINLGEGKKPN